MLSDKFSFDLVESEEYFLGEVTCGDLVFGFCEVNKYPCIEYIKKDGKTLVDETYVRPYGYSETDARTDLSDAFFEAVGEEEGRAMLREHDALSPIFKRVQEEIENWYYSDAQIKRRKAERRQQEREDRAMAMEAVAL